MKELCRVILFVRGDQKFLTCFFFFFFFFSVDDSLLFCRAKIEEINTIQNILKVYEKASGQQINTNKTTLFFSNSMTETTTNAIKDLLGVSEIKQYEKYLGLPTVVGKNRRASLNYIKDRVWGKL